MTTDDLTSREWKELESSDKAKVFSVYGNQNTFIFPNLMVEPFDNKLFRQALAFAMPYQAIVDSVYYGSAKVWQGCVPSSFPGFKKVDTYKEDVAKAKELLTQAGYPGGQGLEKFGDALTMYYVAEKQDKLQSLATLIQTALKKIDVNVKLAPIPQADFGKRMLVTKNLPFALDDQEESIAADAGYAIQLFFTSTAKGGLNNMSNYSNANVDELWLNDAKNDPDSESRNATLGKIQDIVMDDVAWIPLVERKTQIAASNDLTHYAYDPGNSILMRYWKRA